MADIYTIKLEDAATPNAYRVAQALSEVSIASIHMAEAIRSGDLMLKEMAADASKVAAINLRLARTINSAGAAASKLGPKIPTKPLKEGTDASFKFSYALNALTNQAINLGFALARRLVSGLVDTAEGMYNVADLASRAHMSFANFYGGQAKGDQVLRESIDIAKRYGFTIDEVVAQMNRFGAAGFSAEQAKGTMRFGADMMAAGRSVADVKGIFLAMTQIMGKGKLQAEELTQQLAERGINAGRVWKIMAGILHKNVDEVMKLQKAGKIGPGLALNAIVQAGVEGVHGSAIGKAGEKVADETIGGLGRRMGTLWEDAIFEAVDRASPALVKGMQSLFGGMNTASTTGLQDTLTASMEKVGQIIEMIGPKLPAIVDGFTKAFGAASGFNNVGWQSFVDSLPAAAANMGAIAGAFAKIAAISASLLTGEADKGHGGFWEFMTTPMNKQGSFWNKKLSGNGTGSGLVSEGTGANVMNMVIDAQNRKSGDESIAEGMGAAIGDMADNILKQAPSAAKAATGAAQGAIDASNDTLMRHSPSKVFSDMGADISKGLALGIDNNADLAVHSATQMSQGAIAASGGASGLDLRRTVAAGSAAGASMSSSRSLSVNVGDLHFGGGAGGAAGGGGDAMSEARSYFETEFVSMLERHLEGAGA